MSVIHFDDYMWCPIHPFSEDLDEGRYVADDVFTGTRTVPKTVGLMMGRSVGMCQFENGEFGASIA